MAALQEALDCLSPITWEEVPTDPESLRAYINDLSKKAHLIVNSVPEQPPPTTHHHNTDRTSPSSRIKPSSIRLNTTVPTLQSLQKEWSKPVKVSGARDNPLEILIHKLPGSDGKGHWFGRRSVHEGLPFSKWQEALSAEMLETLKANQERMKHGQTPDKSVRGIGAEKQVETIEVRDEAGERVVAHVNVFHVSAQFPKPTTPRDFVSLIVSWEVEVDDEGDGGRCWMMVSRPVEHDDAPPVSGYIRGQYESVEFIREIPVKRRGGDGASSLGTGSKGSDKLSGSTNGVDGKVDGMDAATKEKVAESKEEEGGEEPNPVEWIMVTRSDPGGNIPRWMVEKGTPKSICTDAVKFLDWACRDTNTSAGQETDGFGQGSTVKRRRSSQHTAGVQEVEDSDISDSDFADTEVEHHGLIASFAYLLNAGLERYAPQAVLDYFPLQPHHYSGDISDFTSDDEDKSRRPSGDSPLAKNPMEGTGKDDDDILSRASQDKASSINSGLATPLEAGPNNIPPAELMQIEKKDGKLSSHEKQLAKLAQRKRDVEAQLEKVRDDIRSYNLPTLEDGAKRDKASTAALVAADSSDQVSTSAGSSNQRPSFESRPSKHGHQASSRETAKMHKVASGLFNEESKLLKQLGKIERHQLKEASKIEAQQRKQADREEKSRSRTETDILRHENGHLKKELERLRGERRQWLDLIASLQEENANLAAAAGQTGKL
ncbi:hypothetical protein BDV29DRAFT_166194 [Aspergillus leporis]|jgi:hypothetical protein|uniref:DUF3074 domain-containing protein n=1 Tax=Aspergillus leporis TaxID=41062 RepID=A0A5N5XEQ3_9EURO|nr:hypothetical protein BDV29DRAFT_166194 [Aspergillus leporis]